MTPASQSATERLNLILATLGTPTLTDSTTARAELSAVLAGADRSILWFTLAVLRAKFPTEEELELLRRTVLLKGADRVARSELDRLERAIDSDSIFGVEVVADAVTIDPQISRIANCEVAAQRTVLTVLDRWRGTYDFIETTWTPGLEGLQRAGEEPRVLVPWRGVHVVLPQVFEYDRIAALFALGRYANTALAAVGHSYLPLAGQFASEELTARFTKYSSMLGEANRIAAVSRSVAAEFRGHRRVLRAGGAPGADIAEIPPPTEPHEPTEAELEHARRLVTLPGLPAIVVPGEHGDEQNDLAVLHAAELLWRDGVKFSLTFIGHGDWHNEVLSRRVARLRAVGRPVDAIRNIDPASYAAAYRCAHGTLFPPLYAGSGLPVARSLAAGTPVITSNYGSTAEIVAPDGEPHGGLLVDPRDDHAIAEALRRLLTDDVLHRRLVDEATQRRFGTWDEYAAQAWDYLVEGKRPGS